MTPCRHPSPLWLFACMLVLTTPLCGADLYVHTGATLTCNSGTEIVATHIESDSGSTIEAAGVLTANLTVNGDFTVNEGVTIDGSWTLSSSSIVRQSIGEGDLVSVTGAVGLAGALHVTLTDGAEATEDDSFTLISAASLSGDYSSSSLPTLVYGYDWSLTQDAGDLNLSLYQSVSDFHLWAYTNGLDPDAADLTSADDDGDGLGNFLEFSFDLDPNSADTSPLVVTGSTDFSPGTPTMEWDFSNGVSLTLQMVRLKNYTAEGMTYQFETSENLESWSAVSASFTVISDDGGDYEVVEAIITSFNPDENADVQFCRVTVQ